jgi:hypothetical protein
VSAPIAAIGLIGVLVVLLLRPGERVTVADRAGQVVLAADIGLKAPPALPVCASPLGIMSSISSESS